MAKGVNEWATSGGERWNTAAYGHGILMDVFRMALGIDVNEAGSISWRSGARRLVDSAARRLDGPSAHRPSGTGPGSDLRHSARSDHQTEPRLRCPGEAETNPSVTINQSPGNQSYCEKKLDLGRGCGWCISLACQLSLRAVDSVGDCARHIYTKGQRPGLLGY